MSEPIAITVLPRRWPPEWLIEIGVVLVLGAFKLWLTNAWAVAALGWAGHDDRLYLLRAESILAGQWLGPYDELTLIRGVGYPLFIALVHVLGLPLLVAHQAAYVVASSALARAFAPHLGLGARVGLFVLVLFNPMTFTTEVATRVIREGIYPALTLFVIAGVVGMLLRIVLPARSWLPWALLAATSLPVFWHTREEGPWIGPLLLCAAVVLLLRVRREGSRLHRPVLAAAAIVVALFAGAWAAIVLTNGSRYGAFVTVDLKQKEFVRAYGSLLSVRQQPMVPRVPVPREARERIYAVSPAFAELRPFLEGEIGTRWESSSSVPREIDGGLFLFTFREAVGAAGYYSRGAAAVNAYYDRLTREIEEARRAGKLDARQARSSLVPALMAGQRSGIVRTWLEGCASMVRFDLFASHQMHSSGSDEDLRTFGELTRTPLRPRESKQAMQLHVAGTATRHGRPLEVSVEDAGGSKVPGASTGGGGWRSAFEPSTRFEARLPIDESFLVLSEGGREVERIRASADPPRATSPGVQLSISHVGLEVVGEEIRPSHARRFRLMKTIARVYQAVFPAAAVLIALSWSLSLLSLLRQPEQRDLAIMVVGLAGAVAARVLVLSLIEVTSGTVMYARYQAAGHAALMVASFLAAHQAAAAIRTRFAGRRQPV